MPKRTPLYTLKAELVLRGLTLRQVAKRAGVPYTRASEILNGHRIDTERLSKLKTQIERFPRPESFA